jgi:serine/threonine protein kinase
MIILDVLLKRHGKITRIPLVHEAVPVSTHAVHALLRVLAFWVRHWAPFIAARQIPPLDNLLPDITCLEVDGYMYKAFRTGSDRNASMYRHLSVPVEYVVRRIRGMTIIRYPKIEGGHVPQTLAHVCSLLGAVIALHHNGVVHADLRFYNVVFKTDNMAALLDFDLSGQPGKTYPPGFNQGIPDGVRHSDAVSGRPMQFAHDVFSLIAMLKSLKLSNKTHNAEYQALLKSSNSLEAIHAELLELNQALKFTVSVRDQSRPAPHVGSGSPATVNAQPPPPDSSGTSSDAAPQVGASRVARSNRSHFGANKKRNLGRGK